MNTHPISTQNMLSQGKKTHSFKIRLWGGLLGVLFLAGCGLEFDDPKPRQWKQLDLGENHSCVSAKSGEVKCWGGNAKGQLGLGHTRVMGDDEALKVIPEISLTQGMHIGPDGGLHLEGSIGASRTSGQIRVASLALGKEHTCIALLAGEVRCWGFNASGQLGLGNTSNLGDGEAIAQEKPLPFALSPAVADDLRTRFSELKDRLGAKGEIIRAEADLISAGDAHTCAMILKVKSVGGLVYCWGDNSEGQLGRGNSAALAQYGDGPGERVGGQTFDPLKFLAVQISAGGKHTCAVLKGNPVNEQVLCWGDNQYGQLGLQRNQIDLTFPEIDLRGVKINGISYANLGDNEPVVGFSRRINPLLTVRTTVALPSTVSAVAAGGAFSCALLKSTQEVRCWGRNNAGQLGLGNTNDLGDNEAVNTTAVPLGGRAKAIAAGKEHACSLLTSGKVLCWGRNDEGQLGLGNRNNLGDDEAVSTASPINLGTSATAIAAGGAHTCVLFGSGSLLCWGRNDEGQLGRGNTTTIDDAKASN